MLMQKRLKLELQQYGRSTDNKDVYCIDYDESDFSQVHAVIKGPVDSLYAYSFIRVKMEFNDQYPFVPPKVTFYNHRATRIHPNLYGSGKVCLSILGTWQGPVWTSTMTIDTLLRTIQSLLDNEPMRHEPGMSNSPVYNHFVEREKWNTLLLSYLEHEQRPVLRNYMIENTRHAEKEIEAQISAQANVPRPSGSLCYSNSAPTGSKLIWEKIKAFL